MDEITNKLQFIKQHYEEFNKRFILGVPIKIHSLSSTDYQIKIDYSYLDNSPGAMFITNETFDTWSHSI